MKFFTEEWWFRERGEENDSAVLEIYGVHWSHIKPMLPPDLVRAYTDFSFHDSVVRKIAHDVVGKHLIMELDGWDVSMQKRQYYVLTFGEVDSVELPGTVSVNEPENWGDLGYWECDLVDVGVAVRMLFSSRIELEIQFRYFQLLVRDDSDRHAGQ